MQKWMLTYLLTLFAISLISSLKTETNYDEICDITSKTRAFCPSENSTIGRKIFFEKFGNVAEVTCDASESNDINYLNYLPNMGRISQLVIINCSALNGQTTISKLYRNSTIATLQIYDDFGVKLTAENFHGLDKLTDLKIRKSSLTTLEADCLQHLDSLKSITFTWNQFTHLPANLFNNTKKLSDVFMSYNRLQHLPENIFEELKVLDFLDLSNNELATLPDDIFRNTTALSTLILSDNKLSAVNEKLFATLINLEYIDLSNNQLLSVYGNAFSNMPRLVELRLNNNSIELQPPNDNFIFPPKLEHLRLNGNAITSFNGAWFSACKSMSYINMSHNSIAGVQNHDLIFLANPKLTMDLSYNSIRYLNFPQADHNHSQFLDKKMYYLSQNPWQCDCESAAFLRFIKSNARIIGDFNEMRCNNTEFNKNLISELETTEICPPDQAFIITLVSVAGFSAFVGILWALFYKYHHKITIWLYAHDMCLRCITETELDHDKIYDAFISFSSKDEQFIAEHLQPQLELSAKPFRLCIHSRDWLVGEVIADQIMRSIELSRRTIIVLSQNFITSSWSLMEFRAAHQAALNEGRVRVIIIIYGEINDMEHLDPLLKSYLDMHTYLEWGDPWFWEKLRYAMPHPRRRGVEVRPNFDDVELNKIQ